MNASLIGMYMTPDTTLTLPDLEEMVRVGGFELRNPKTGRITVIDNDGDFHAIERDTLAAQIHLRQGAQFQFWECNPGPRLPRDLYCRVRFKHDSCVVDYGELPRAPTALLRGIWGFASAKLDVKHILGLVVDIQGRTEEYANWDLVILSQSPFNGPCPDLLCLTSEMARQLPESCDGHRRAIRGDYTIAYDDELPAIIED